jgi:ferredoxin
LNLCKPNFIGKISNASVEVIKCEEFARQLIDELANGNWESKYKCSINKDCSDCQIDVLANDFPWEIIE